jgi:hypothetical protein
VLPEGVQVKPPSSNSFSLRRRRVDSPLIKERGKGEVSIKKVINIIIHIII